MSTEFTIQDLQEHCEDKQEKADRISAAAQEKDDDVARIALEARAKGFRAEVEYLKEKIEELDDA